MTFLSYLDDEQVKNLNLANEFQVFNSPFYKNLQLFFDGTKIVFKDAVNYMLADYSKGESLLNGIHKGDYLVHGDAKVTQQTALAVEAYRAVWYNNLILQMNIYSIVFYDELKIPMQYSYDCQLSFASNGLMIFVDTGDRFVCLDKVALDVISSMVNFSTAGEIPTAEELEFVENYLHKNSNGIKMYKLNGYLHINDIMITNPNGLIKLL